jgi:hypothetical protein
MNYSLFQAGTTIRSMRLSKDWPGDAKDSASNSLGAPSVCGNHSNQPTSLASINQPVEQPGVERGVP